MFDKFKQKFESILRQNSSIQMKNAVIALQSIASGSVSNKKADPEFPPGLKCIQTQHNVKDIVEVLDYVFAKLQETIKAELV